MTVDHHQMLLQLIGSLTLCDHMGDVSNAVCDVMEKLFPDDDSWNEGDFHDLGTWLGKRGVTTLLGTPLFEPDGDGDGAEIKETP